MNDKYELFEYFKNVKNPNLCRESFFKKRFENIYMDFKNSIFYSLNFSFKERLYLFFSDDYDLTLFKCKCGNKKRFHSFNDGYYKFCCHICAANDEKTKIKTKETVDKFSEEYKNDINKRKSEKLKHYYENIDDDMKKFLSDRCFNNIHSSKEKENEIIEKIKKRKKEWTEDEREIHHINYSNGQLKRNKKSWKRSKLKCKKTRNNWTKERYDEFINNCKKASSNLDKINKILETKKKNKTISSSSFEKMFEEYLLKNNIKFKREHKTDKYPFFCDFFILENEIYVEIQGNWTHGKHPFDENNKEDINIVNYWKEKNTPYYKKAIKDWTIRDVIKRKIAKDNNLNFLEIFPKNFKDIINQFNNYYEQLQSKI